MTASNGQSVALTVSDAGVLTGSMQGCSVAGTVVPNSGGKNYFDVNFQFGPAPCPFPGAPGVAVALSFPLENGSRQLLIAVVNVEGYGFWGLAMSGTR